jgi:hypothetical protein
MMIKAIKSRNPARPRANPLRTFTKLFSRY